MKVITQDEFEMKKSELQKRILDGNVFIYPTDTIYGIGCDATNSDCVKKIREIKKRQEMPFSVIAPSKEWIIENCDVDKVAMEWVDKLPGPYTLILKLKNSDALSKHVNNGKDTIGVRIPNHWISKMVSELNTPVITTSTNLSGKEYMTSMDDLDPEIHSKVDFVLYEGEKQGKPSKIVDLDSGDEIER